MNNVAFAKIQKTYSDEAECRLGHDVHLHRDGRLRVEEDDLAIDVDVLLAWRDLDIESGVSVVDTLHRQRTEHKVVEGTLDGDAVRADRARNGRPLVEHLDRCLEGEALRIDNRAYRSASRTNVQLDVLEVEEIRRLRDAQTGDRVRE